MQQFTNKVAIVTGGGSGIGKAAALELAGQGAAVVIANRNKQAGELTVQEITNAGGKATFIQTDVSNEAQVKHLVEQTVATYGRLDMAFNNAGIEQPPMPLTEQTEALYHQVMDINVKGIWLCLKYQIPAMLAHGGGSIVN